MVMTCLTLFLVFYSRKRNGTIDLLWCTSDDCLRTIISTNSSQNASGKYFESLRNSSLRKIDLKPDQYKHCFCSNHSQNETNHTGKECSFILDRSVLIHRPPLLAHLQKTPCLLMDEWLSNIRPIYSVILTVWNQERLIDQTLRALLNHTREWWELVVVFDQCRDQSISIVKNIVQTFINQCNQPMTCRNPHLVHIRLINQISDVAETTANNIGMRASHTDTAYFILIKDDTVVRQNGWNSLLAIPLRLWTDVFSVSGRCAHDFWSIGNHGSIGRCGVDVDSPLWMSCAERSNFYVRDSGNRGPLLLHAARTRLLGYLDEKNYWLGDDDHDLNFRAFASNRWVAGFQPLDFDAPLEFGGTRRKVGIPMTTEDIQYRNLRIDQKDKKLGAVHQFRSRKWRKGNVTIELSPNIAAINFHTYMKDRKNSNDLQNGHDHTRPIPSDILHCRE